MNKTTRTISIVTMVLLIVSLCGNLFLMSNRNMIKEIQVSGSEEEYSAKYMNFEKEEKKIQKSIYEGAMDSGTSPTEIKYLLLKMGPNLNDEEKDDAIAKYINHIQYFASTYTNIALMYQNILESLSKTIDFSTRDAAYKVSDKVLRNLLLEIWDSDMILYLPENNQTGPSVLVDYDGLKESYGDFITSSTDKYLTLKSLIINGKISNEDGTINYDNLINYMNETYSFLKANPDFAIIQDVKYMYVVAAKMFLNVYMVEDSATLKYSTEDITRIKAFVDSNDGTPAAAIGGKILSNLTDTGTISKEIFDDVQGSFAALSE